MSYQNVKIAKALIESQYTSESQDNPSLLNQDPKQDCGPQSVRERRQNGFVSPSIHLRGRVGRFSAVFSISFVARIDSCLHLEETRNFLRFPLFRRKKYFVPFRVGCQQCFCFLCVCFSATCGGEGGSINDNDHNDDDKGSIMTPLSIARRLSRPGARRFPQMPSLVQNTSDFF